MLYLSRSVRLRLLLPNTLASFVRTVWLHIISVQLPSVMPVAEPESGFVLRQPRVLVSSSCKSDFAHLVT